MIRIRFGYTKYQTSLGVRVEKTTRVSFMFQVFLTIQGKTKAFAPLLYNSYNHAQACTCGQVGAPGLTPSAPGTAPKQ